MATKAKKWKVRFEFESRDEYILDPKGKAPCRICYEDFVPLEVGITLLGFNICPSCVRRGPEEVAKDAEFNAHCKHNFEKMAEDPIDQQGLRKLYFAVAKTLRRVESFLDVPGGAIAVALAAVTPEDLRRGYRRKAA